MPKNGSSFLSQTYLLHWGYGCASIINKISLAMTDRRRRQCRWWRLISKHKNITCTLRPSDIISANTFLRFSKINAFFRFDRIHSDCEGSQNHHTRIHALELFVNTASAANGKIMKWKSVRSASVTTSIVTFNDANCQTLPNARRAIKIPNVQERHIGLSFKTRARPPTSDSLLSAQVN